MHTLTFQCKLLTPLFMSGAKPEYAELRAPSIKGVTRWWFRAMMGGVLGDDTNQLRGLESMVFGNTDGASPISIRVRAIDPTPPRISPQPHFPIKQRILRKHGGRQ